MWLFGKNNFLSIVEDMNDSNQLLVRSRLRGDIEALFPEAEILEDAGNDYRFRAFMERTVVVKAVADAVADIDYSNFKSANDKKRQEHLMKIWDVMYDVQEDAREDEGGMDY